MNKKTLLTVTLMVLTALALVSCAPSGEDPGDTAEHFLELVGDGQYADAYEMLTDAAKEQISTADFQMKYKTIFSGLGVTDVVFGESAFTEAAIYASCMYTATYKTESYGNITKQFTMSLANENDAWKVEWTPSMIFPEMTWGDTVHVQAIPASRGEIFSSDGALVAGNVVGTTVYADRSQIDDLDAYCAAIAPLLSMEPKDVLKRFSMTSANIVTLKSWPRGELSAEQQDAIAAAEATGVDNTSFAVYRTYPFKEAFFHLVGYTGKISEEELASFKGTEKETLYNGDSIIGKTGLEAAYEDRLRGTDGYEVYVNGEGGKRRLTEPVTAIDGEDIHLTIDSRDQLAAYELLSVYAREGEGGSIVQLNPNTGAVQVMVSYPSTDPNAFVRGVTQEEYAYLLSDTAYQPLFNRCLLGRYPPGSIVKPFTGIAAMESGAIKSSSVFPYSISNNKWTPDRSDWFYPPITRVKNRGDRCDLYNSIIYSDNIYFAWAAMEMGAEDFLDYFGNKLKIGETIPFDLSVSRGQLMNEGTEFNIKYLADSGYGQGEVLITPLQAALLYCSLSNDGGEIYVPYVIDSYWRSDGRDYVVTEKREPSLWTTVEHDSDARNAIDKSLRDVTTVGTARSLDPPYDMAGKTGTAETGVKKEREIGWLAVYKNEGAHDSVLVVTIDAETGKSEIKLPIGHYLLNQEVITDQGDAAVTGEN